MISESIVPGTVVEEGSTPTTTSAAPPPESQAGVSNNSLSRNPFKRIKQRRYQAQMKELSEKNEEIDDPREPSIGAKDHLYLLSKFGWFNLILMFFGTIGAVGYVFY